MSNDHVSAGAPPGEAIAGIVHPDDVKHFIEISGANPAGRPKAHVLLHQYLQYSDGTRKDIGVTLTMDKPIVQFFKRAGFVNVYLDFGSERDMDLRVLWDALEAFGRPVNSVSYLDEELETGFYNTPEGPKMVYFPTMDLALSPIGKESSFMIHCYNPALWALSPNKPGGPACVLRLAFLEETVSVVEDLDPVDTRRIQSEIQEELATERERAASATR